MIFITTTLNLANLSVVIFIARLASLAQAMTR